MTVMKRNLFIYKDDTVNMKDGQSYSKIHEFGFIHEVVSQVYS